MSRRTYKIKQGLITEYATLLKIIGRLRSKLSRIGENKALTDPELLNLSRRLDLLITQFMRCRSLVKRK